MKIAIDARFLTHPQVGGFKTYTTNLINSLSRVDNENQYVLYLDRPPIDCDLPQTKNFSYRVVPFSIPGLGMPYREQFALRREITRDAPDVIHFLSNTAPVRMNRKFVLTLHDTIQLSNHYTLKFPVKSSNNKIWAITLYSKWVIHRTATNAKSVITVSGYEKEQIIKDLHIPSERISVTHLAPNPIFKPANEEAKKSSRQDIIKKYGIRQKFILGIGHEPRKRIPQLIKAFSTIAPDHPDLDLVIVSAEERQRSEFQNVVNKLNLSDRVVILGAFSQADLKILLNLAEMFVFPSERESFGLPPLEAMACGAPVIASRRTSIPEIVGNAALLIDNLEPKDIANGIDRILNDGSLKAKLISNGFDRVANFSWEKCAKQTIDIYKKTLEH